jgi:mono/diheme cytochrome c family protein
MTSRVFIPLVLSGVFVIALIPGRAQQAPPRPQAAAAGSADGAVLKQYCMTCHSQRVKQGGLALEGLDLDAIRGDAETWEKVVRKVRTGMMPPSGAPRPERQVLDRLATTLEARLDRAAVPGANLVTPALHRLNRTEYANAVRDLLDLEVDVTTLLPGDGSSDGFDNVAEALSVSPTLIQGYVSAAMKISRLAVGDRTLPPSTTTYPAPAALAQDAHIDGLPLGTRGGMLIRHTFPLDAEYEIGTGGGRGGGPGGGGLDITIDGERVTSANPRDTRVKVTAGPHVIGASVPDRQRGAGVDEIYSDFRTDAAFAPAGGVQTIVITGPHNPTGPGDTPSRRRIFSCRASTSAEETPCARRIVATLARRAYRGPVTPAEIDTLMAFYQEGRKSGDFESGIQQALARVLVAPRFIYRIEEEPVGLAPGTVYRVSDVELASRLSLFLWSSIPDDELQELAAKNRLRTPAVLKQQVKRMLADPRSDAFIKNFAGQWLYLRELANVQTEAKNFDDNLRQAFQRETEMLFGRIVREDRSLIDLLDADYTFVDERLARHYGIPNVRGSYFRQVPLPADSPRRGLLGHGSMLTVTSVATRTSPVSRGKWILENLFGAPPPQPPPGVETNLEEKPTDKPMSLRQRLEQHRSNPVCATCHNIMDPLGFSLENFDLVGTWRESDGPSPIDATGKLADGTPLRGPADLRQALLSRSGAFMTTATEKLLIYALGRPIHYYDMPQVRAIARQAAGEDNRFSALLAGIVESDPFQKRVKR